MRIVIYNNDIEVAQFYEDLCRKLGKEMSTQVELKVYTSSDSLLFDMDDSEFCKKLDIIFLTLNAGNIKIPDRIREAGYTNLIVLIGGEEMVVTYEQLFDMEAYNFVRDSRTPACLERFSQIFQRAREEIAQRRSEKLILSYGGEIQQIAIHDINYFEVQNYTTLNVFYGDAKKFTFISSLSKMENHLKGRKFMRASRFYLVSLDAVQKIMPNSVIMRDGTDIPVGRRYYMALKSAVNQGAKWV